MEKSMPNSDKKRLNLLQDFQSYAYQNIREEHQNQQIKEGE
jgi:hypothetical protein